ncbi:hypothetical protein ACIF83_41025 [Streptomyces sp. NPDC085866]|uniref:hypothetical protein n=1 Tax=Streptomyces sp. NPDC085866 TaxID=3365736 RepID=UPI0037CD58F1
MKKIALGAATLIAVASLSAGSVASAAPMPVQPHPWDKRIKCRAKDPQGRKIVTRYGNSEFGRQDQDYDACRGQTIGVINAFCKNQPGNKCPAWAKL